jgi:hypothetical protein
MYPGVDSLQAMEVRREEVNSHLLLVLRPTPYKEKGAAYLDIGISFEDCSSACAHLSNPAGHYS